MAAAQQQMQKNFQASMAKATLGFDSVTGGVLRGVRMLENWYSEGVQATLQTARLRPAGSVYLSSTSNRLSGFGAAYDDGRSHSGGEVPGAGSRSFCGRVPPAKNQPAARTSATIPQPRRSRRRMPPIPDASPSPSPSDTFEDIVTQVVKTPYAETLDGKLIHTVDVAWYEILKFLTENPDLRYIIPPRKLEEIVAASYEKLGFDEVTLTPFSGDGGRDVIWRFLGEVSNCSGRPERGEGIIRSRWFLTERSGRDRGTPPSL
jgi:hypothetical protein